MGPAVYVMAILGCGEADVPCEPVATLPTHYASQAECDNATEEAIQRHSGALYPVVVAQCRPGGREVVQKVWADEVKLPEAGSGRTPPIRSAAFRGVRKGS